MIADFENGSKEHTIKGEHIIVFVKKKFDISNMGVTSLTSHASDKKHSEIQISRSSNIGATFFGKSNTGKLGLTTKIQLVKKVKKVKEQ